MSPTARDRSGSPGFRTQRSGPVPSPHSALGRNSPPLPKVRRRVPRARSPWSRHPARGPRRCDRLKYVAGPRPSVLLRRPAGKGRQVRLHPAAAPLPPGRLRGRADWRLRERAERRLGPALSLFLSPLSAEPAGLPPPPLALPASPSPLGDPRDPRARPSPAPPGPLSPPRLRLPAPTGTLPLAGAGTRAPQANHRPSWGAGRGGGGVSPHAHPTPAPPGSPSAEC